MVNSYMELQLEGFSIPYRVKNSDKVSRARIEYRKTGFLVVIPSGSNFDAESLLKKKKEWVLCQWESYKEYREKIPARDFDDVSKLKVMGYERNIVVKKRRSNKLGEDIVLASHLVSRSSKKIQIEKLLKSEFRKEIEDRLKIYSTSFDKPYNKIYVRNQRTRWGSCSSKGNLSFNWRLILGPEHLLDYIVVHELAHLKHKNHGEMFWKKVEEVFPEYKQSQKWLDENSHLLIWSKF